VILAVGYLTLQCTFRKTALQRSRVAYQTTASKHSKFMVRPIAPAPDVLECHISPFLDPLLNFRYTVISGTKAFMDKLSYSDVALSVKPEYMSLAFLSFSLREPSCVVCDSPCFTFKFASFYHMSLTKLFFSFVLVPGASVIPLYIARSFGTDVCPRKKSTKIRPICIFEVFRNSQGKLHLGKHSNPQNFPC